MRAPDRVAIHEAMEQQTISVAKAGITTILNSRTSVLAAANPVFGKYDDLKQISDQIDLQTTILSRFDCIFIVRDVRNEQHDKKLAGHIIDLHIGKGDMEIEESTMDLNWLKKYIAYSKSHYNPRLTEVITLPMRTDAYHFNSKLQLCYKICMSKIVERFKKINKLEVN